MPEDESAEGKRLAIAEEGRKTSQGQAQADLEIPMAGGWGGDGRERWLPTAAACQRHCRLTADCNFWTFDSTGMYIIKFL